MGVERGDEQALVRSRAPADNAALIQHRDLLRLDGQSGRTGSDVAERHLQRQIPRFGETCRIGPRAQLIGAARRLADRPRRRRHQRASRQRRDERPLRLRRPAARNSAMLGAWHDAGCVGKWFFWSW